MNNYYNIPERLRGPQSTVYCCHKDKRPTHGTKPDKLSTFFSFDEALKMMQPDEGLGIGMWGKLCGIDIDHCVEYGVISEQAQVIIDFFDSYAELSMSGTGIHILFLCEEQYKDADKYYTKLNKKHLKEKGATGMGGLEFYQGFHDHRYLTLTGNKVHDMNKEFVSGEDVKAFLNAFFYRPPATTVNVEFDSSDAEDQAWIKWALFEKKPTKLIECWFKTPTGSGGTESEDDFIFMNELSFWCNHNAKVMKTVFESSRYYKAKDAKHLKKWSRKDYCETLINKANASNKVAKIYFEDSYAYNPITNKIEEVTYESNI